MNNIVIYNVASMFNGRERCFNSQLTKSLENFGYEVILPQRDGFTYSILTESFAKLLPEERVSTAVRTVIYYLDMGLFIPKCDVVVSNLDDPIDEGVNIEMAYSKIMDKLTIGFRTDVRTPYGSNNDKLKGLMFFPAFQNDVMIYHDMLAGDDVEEYIKSLAGNIHNEISKRNIRHNELPENFMNNRTIETILRGAEILFKDVKDIHSEDGINDISDRYVRNIDQLETVWPKII